jgi:hypothetical protein
MAVAFDAKTAAYTSVTAGTTISMTNLTVGAGANRGLYSLPSVWQPRGQLPCLA